MITDTSIHTQQLLSFTAALLGCIHRTSFSCEENKTQQLTRIFWSRLPEIAETRDKSNQSTYSCQQHTKGEHLPGKVILASDLCCSSSLFSVLNKKTLKARCNSPDGERDAMTWVSVSGSQGLGRPEGATWYSRPPCARGPRPAARRPRGHLSRCSRSGGSSSWSLPRSSGRSRRRGCTSPPWAAPAARPGRPCSPPASPPSLRAAPGTWGRGSQSRRTPPLPPQRRAPGRAYSHPRYPRAGDPGPPATSPHGWVRLRDAIRKRSARPSARRARTPARLPTPHRRSPPYLRHEPSTVGCTAGGVSFRLRPKARAPPPIRAPPPEAARPIARAGARARHIAAGQWCAGPRPTSRSRGGATPDLQASPPTALGCGTFPRPPRGCSRCLQYTAEVTLLDGGTAWRRALAD